MSGGITSLDRKINGSGSLSLLQEYQHLCLYVTVHKLLPVYSALPVNLSVFADVGVLA